MREIDAAGLEAALSEGGRLIDVREPEEYAQVHVPGAVLIPMGQLTARMNELDRGKPVYVICASGNRSRAMTDLLLAANYDAVNVTGGTTAWLRTGRPVNRGLAATGMPATS